MHNRISVDAETNFRTWIIDFSIFGINFPAIFQICEIRFSELYYRIFVVVNQFFRGCRIWFPWLWDLITCFVISDYRSSDIWFSEVQDLISWAAKSDFLMSIIRLSFVINGLNIVLYIWTKMCILPFKNEYQYIFIMTKYIY